MDLGIDERRLIGLLQAGELGHTDLYRRARRIHERKLADAVDAIVSMTDGGQVDIGAAALSLFHACTPAIPYAAAFRFPRSGEGQAGAQRRRSSEGRADADRVGGMHGVTHTIQQIRERGVRGFDVEVIGTDADVDRRLSAVAEIDVPFCRGLKIGIPGVPAMVDAVAEGRYDLVHLCAPGPSGLGAWLLARVLVRGPAD
jgi:hypothetical protein